MLLLLLFRRWCVRLAQDICVCGRVEVEERAWPPRLVGKVGRLDRAHAAHRRNGIAPTSPGRTCSRTGLLLLLPLPLCAAVLWSGDSTEEEKKNEVRWRVSVRTASCIRTLQKTTMMIREMVKRISAVVYTPSTKLVKNQWYMTYLAFREEQ
jgi:hypothetical protein